MNYALSIVWNPPKGLDLGFFTLHYYSLLWVAAFGAGWYLMKHIYKREGESHDNLDKLFIYTIIATMLGARIGHVLFYQSELFAQDPLSVFLPFSFNPKFEFTGFQGLASHGAAIAVLLTMIYYSKKVIHRPVLWILDRITIPVACGGILIRIANFVNSEILGDVTSQKTLTAVKFIRGEDFLNDQNIAEFTGEQDINKAFKLIETDPQYSEMLANIPYRHPAQLYEAFGYIFVFAIIYYMYWKTDSRKHHGLIFGVFLVLLWSVRFVVEFVKESQGGFEGSNPLLQTGQWLSVPFILLGLYLIVTAKKKTETL